MTIRWHRSRSSPGVYTGFILAALFMLLSPAGAAAQSWLDAYNAGDYRTAAALLRPLVIEPPPEQMFPDASAAEHLASMYAHGLGVKSDAVLACSLFQIAELAAHAEGSVAQDVESYRREGARRAQFITRREAHCDRLSETERADAGVLLGCFTDDFDPYHFELAGDHTVDVMRGGVRVRYGKTGSVQPLPANGCIADVPLVRYTRTEGPPPTTASRHFIEVYSWSRVNREGRRALVWHLWEIVGGEVQGRAMETLATHAGTDWPPPALSFAVADVRLEMTAAGEVAWQFNGETNRHGVIGVIESPPRTRALPPIADSAGSGSVQIRAADHAGLAKSGVTVRLVGPSPREGKTAQDGALTFEHLVPGRYDVLAGDAGDVMSPLPPFVDITTGAAPPVDVTLKRAGRMSGMIACGIAAPATLRAFVESADAVVHVRVTGQRAFEAASDLDYRRILTTTEARVITPFKRAAAGGLSGSVTVLQVGGAIDRGDTVDHLSYNHLPPLSVGDDYVLFLTRQPDDALMIHFAEEGAFRLRNGRVEPLGGSAIATEWKSASAREFLAELRAASRR